MLDFYNIKNYQKYKYKIKKKINYCFLNPKWTVLQFIKDDEKPINKYTYAILINKFNYPEIIKRANKKNKILIIGPWSDLINIYNYCNQYNIKKIYFYVENSKRIKF